jgi:hypothetical protein
MIDIHEGATDSYIAFNEIWANNIFYYLHDILEYHIVLRVLITFLSYITSF